MLWRVPVATWKEHKEADDYLKKKAEDDNDGSASSGDVAQESQEQQPILPRAASPVAEAITNTTDNDEMELDSLTGIKAIMGS
jgi:hypothetical protein